MFLVIVAVHVFSEIKMPGDGRWVLHTSMSILADGDTDLSEYDLDSSERNLYWIDGAPYNEFPVGSSLWALPVVALRDTGMRLFAGRNYQSELLAGHHSDMQEICASLAIGTAALLLWSMAGEFGLDRRRALLLVVLFSFGTSAWSAGSRGLWSHGPSMVFLGAALLGLIRAERRPGSLWGVGAALALAFVTRPTSAVSVVGLTVYAIWRFRRRSLGLVIAGIAGGALFAWHNLAVYGSLLPPYFQPGRIGDSDTMLQALAANLVSPGRGLLVFTPVLLFSVAGWRRWQADGRWRTLINVLAGIIVVHWIVISRFPHWWAGWCYGPRFFTEMLLYFAVLLVPVVRDLEFRTRAGRWRSSAFATALILGIVIHWAGANREGPMQWNATPGNIDEHPERIWDWHDHQFLRRATD